MKYKNVFFFTGAFPFWFGEQFVDDEFEELSKMDSNIVVICISNKEKKTEYKRTLSKAKAHYIEIEISKFEKIFILRYLFFKKVLKEVWGVLKDRQYQDKLQLIKIILLDFAKARKIYSNTLPIIREYSFKKGEQNLFYSYWHDIRAIGMTMLKNQYSNSKFISRAHRWDIYFEENKPKYLSFKKWMFNNLDYNILISDDAKKYIEERFPGIPKKICIHKLGKNNVRQHLTEKKNESYFTICSCSSVTEVKRLERIINSLCLIKTPNVKWIHFGDGPLMKEIKTLSNTKLKNISFEFKGNRSNKEILDYYSENFIDLFINLSSSEGIPVSIMEALSAAIPVLATDVGGVSEIINNKNGYLINKDLQCSNISIILEEHFNKSNEDMKEMRKNAREFWFKNYNASKNYKRFINFLNENLE